MSSISPARQRLVRLCQATNFGSIRDLQVRAGEPLFDPPPEVHIDLRLDSADPARSELCLDDFDLPGEVVRLFERLTNDITRIELIEIRAGIPRRVVMKTTAGAQRPHSSEGRA